MALFEMHIFSEALGIQTTVNVIIPQRSTNGEIGVSGGSKEEKYKCLYLLHGLSDDYSIWLRRTSIERYAADYGICVVMPSADRSFYTDMKYGGKYFTYVSDELPRLMREFFNVSDKREDNFIAGLSMGGYGALKIGMRCPETFGAAAGLSSVADIRDVLSWTGVTIPIFGDSLEVPPSEDLFFLAEEGAKKEVKPRLYMGVGTSDYLYDGNVRLKEKLKSLPYDFTYYEAEGEHNWEFWETNIRNVLGWMFG